MASPMAICEQCQQDSCPFSDDCSDEHTGTSDEDGNLLSAASAWVPDGNTLRPKKQWLDRYIALCAAYAKTDVVVEFIFSPRYKTSSAFVHESRLLWAGGPFAALAKGSFMEAKEGKVYLCPEDDPGTFGVV